MSEELIKPDNLDKFLLRAILDDASIEAVFSDDDQGNEDGDLMVHDVIKCIVLPDPETEIIRLQAFFTFTADSSLEDRFECVNKINNEFNFVRAIVGDEDALIFKADILVTGGITHENFIRMVRIFCAVPGNAVEDYDIIN